MVGQITRPGVVWVFLVGSVAAGWIVTGLAALVAAGPAVTGVAALLVSVVPAVVAVALIRFGHDHDAARILRHGLTTVRAGWRWYVAALAVLPLVHLGGLVLSTLVGGRPVLNPALIALLPLFLITSLGEEIGWRGYAVPKLQTRLSPFKAGLIVGIAWAVFHWLALLGNGDAAPAYIAISTALLVAMSVILTYMYNGTGLLLAPVVLAHAMYNTFSVGVAPIADTGAPLAALGFSAVIAWLVAGWLVVRDGRKAVLGPAQAQESPA